MNVTGVSTAPLTPPVHAVSRPARAEQTSEQTSGAPQKRSPEEAAAAAAAAAVAAAERRAAQKLPPLKPLTTTEMRVILGALPPSQAVARGHDGSVKGGSFDAYA